MDVYHGFENETATMFFSLKTFSSFNNIFIKTYIYLERNILESYICDIEKVIEHDNLNFFGGNYIFFPVNIGQFTSFCQNMLREFKMNYYVKAS